MNNLGEQLNQPISEEEKVKAERPDASLEVQDDESKYDEMIEAREDAYNNVDKFFKEEVLNYDSGAREIINERKTKEMVSLNKHDEHAYKDANFLRKTLGRYTGGSKFVKNKEFGMLDKTKMHDSVKDTEIDNLSPEEIIDLAKTEGIDNKEAINLKYSKNFKQIDGGLLKTISRDATENEKMDTAKGLIKERVDNWRDKQGVDLIEDKEKLASHSKDSKELDELLESDMISESVKVELKEKREEEIGGLEENIKFKEENLRTEIEEYARPLEEQKKESSNIIEEFSNALNEVSDKEKELTRKTKVGEKDLKKAEKLSMPESVRKGIMEEIKTQIEQAKVNMEVYSRMKKDISDRLSVTKAYNKQVESTLKELNSIGKTKKELMEEKKAEEDALKSVTATGGIPLSKKVSGGTNSKIDQEEKISTNLFGGATHEEAEAWEKSRKRGEATLIESEEYLGGDETQAESKQSKKEKTDNPSTSLPSTPLRANRTDQRPEKSEKKENNNGKMKVFEIIKFLNIGDGKNRDMVVKYFKAGKEFDKNKFLSVDEAKATYSNYLFNYKFRKNKDSKNKAIEIAEKAINKIFNIENINKEPIVELTDIVEDKNVKKKDSVKSAIVTNGTKEVKKVKVSPSGNIPLQEALKDIEYIGGANKEEKPEEDKEKERERRIKVESLIDILSTIDPTLKAKKKQEKFFKSMGLKDLDTISLDRSEGIYAAHLRKVDKRVSKRDSNIKAGERFYNEEGEIRNDIKNILI